MHELSIAAEIVEIASSEAAKVHASAVERVHVRIGALSGVVAEALQFSFELAAGQTPLEGAVLKIEEVPVVAFCPRCADEWTADVPLRLYCPRCGQASMDVRRGRELEITSIELEQP